MEVHIGKGGVEKVIPAGYMNRAARRKYAKIMKRGGTHQLLARMRAQAQ